MVSVPGISDAIDLATGAKHTCVLRANGEVWCWGNNDHGQLGDGTTLRRFDPVRVIGLTVP
jgi:alpha-tubulin suppressor-like RCC1 family protein